VGLWETNRRQPKAYLVPQVINFLGYAPWTAPDGFGAWLRQARRALGLSRRKLAARLSVDESTVFRWEAGQGSPARAVRRRLLRVLGSEPAPG